MRKILTYYNACDREFPGEPGGGEIITDASMYEELPSMIERMRRSGQIIPRVMYDPSETEEPILDPVRSDGWDIVDIVPMAQQAQAVIDAAIAQAQQSGAGAGANQSAGAPAQPVPGTMEPQPSNETPTTPTA